MSDQLGKLNSRVLRSLPECTMKGLIGCLSLPAKHLETIVIFSILTTVTTAFVYLVAIVRPSISVFRIAIITLGSTMICSVLVCLMSGYIRSHSHRKCTFPQRNEPKRTHQATCVKSQEVQQESNCNLCKVIAIPE